jgi:hypothetical protein
MPGHVNYNINVSQVKMSSRGSQLISNSCILEQTPGKGNVIQRDTCIKIKTEVTELQNELKSAMLMLRLLQEGNNLPRTEMISV